MTYETQLMMHEMYPDDFKVPANVISPTLEVDYDDPSHTYYLGNTIYRSATKIVEQFHAKFDTQYRAEQHAYRYGKTPEYWIGQWRDINGTSLVRGKELHDQQERFLYNQGFTTVARSERYIHRVLQQSSDIKGTQNRYAGISDLADGCYPELKLWRHDWCIAGRADKPTFETIGSVRYAHVEDYKTNKVLNTRGYVDRWGNENMMLAPLSHLPDCEMTHYTLQLSIYQYMLEYFGFKPGLRRIIHFPHPIEDLGTPKPVPHELPYLRREVEVMLYTLNLNGWLKIPLN